MHEHSNAIKILFISEVLFPPFDEGIKNIAYSIHKHLKKKARVLSLTKAGNNQDDLDVVKVRLNKLFLNNRLRKDIKQYSPNIILYLPEASTTFNSFLRAKALKLMNKTSMVVILAVKQVAYSSICKRLISGILKPDMIMLLSEIDKEMLIKRGIKVTLLPPPVDSSRFFSPTEEEKTVLRKEYNIPLDYTVVLHVGHIRSTRNIHSLIELQKIDKIQVVIVGSSSTPTEGDLKNRLIKAHVRLIDEYVPDISKIYRMSDIYVFPVLNKIACIDIPLSILEAMACNLPVLTTRFGALVEYFKEDAGFRYFETTEQLMELVERIRGIDMAKVKNNKKVEPFSWEKFANEIIHACAELL